MAVKEILRLGHPVLRQIAKPVEHFDYVLDNLITDLFDTMRAANGVGLAAPQIGVGLRVVIFGLQRSERYPEAEAVPQTILINPLIEPQGKDWLETWEGCLSVPGLRGLVPRHASIRYRGQDEQGRLIDRLVSGFHAVVVQHECDHLDGILYPQRIRDMRQFGFEEELAATSNADDPA